MGCKTVQLYGEIVQVGSPVSGVRRDFVFSACVEQKLAHLHHRYDRGYSHRQALSTVVSLELFTLLSGAGNSLAVLCTAPGGGNKLHDAEHSAWRWE